MNYTSLSERFSEWKTEMKRVIETGNAVPVAAASPEWYVGLAVSPVSFSRQLGDMQVAMLRANTMRPDMGQTGGAESKQAGVQSQLSA